MTYDCDYVQLNKLLVKLKLSNPNIKVRINGKEEIEIFDDTFRYFNFKFDEFGNFKETTRLF